MKKIIFYLFLISSVAFGQDTKDTILIQEVTLLDNRLNTPLSKENRNIYILSKEEIKSLPARNITEILQYAAGVDIRQRGPFGTQADISIDGGSFEQTLILLNGAKIMDHQTSHNVLNLPISLEIIDRIEIIRGPAARVYGNNSLTGVINIITTQPKNNSLLLTTAIGSNFKNAEEKNNIYWGRNIQIGGSYVLENQKHQLYFSNAAGNGYRYNTAFENNKIFYQTDLEINTNNIIQAYYGYVKNNFGANGFYASPGDKDAQEIIETTLATVQSKHQINNKLKISPRITYRYNFDDYRYLRNNLNRARSKHYSNAITTDINSVYQINNGQIGFGLEYRNEQINSTSIKNHYRDNYGVYAEYKTDITPKLNINLGTYLNYNSQYGWKLFPGLDTSYKFTNNLSVLFNIGTSQRIPSFTDLYLDQRPGNIGNDQLTSEKSFQAEVGIKYKKNNFNFNAYYFYRNITDFIDWIRNDESLPWQSHNFGDLKTNGFNTKVGYLLFINNNQTLKVNLSYSFISPKYKNPNKSIPTKYKIESLRHQLINTIDYKNRNTSIIFATRFYERQNYKNYLLNDIKINQRVNKLILIYLDVVNLFNTNYNEAGSIPLPSRWINFGLKFAIIYN